VLCLCGTSELVLLIARVVRHVFYLDMISSSLCALWSLVSPESVGEGEYSVVSPERSAAGSQDGPSTAVPSSVPETSTDSVQSSPAHYTQDFTSASPSPGKTVSLNINI